jgi:transmembrane sensor
MSNVVRLPRREDALDEASRWLARLDRNLTGEETAELREWLAEDPGNPAALMEIAALWDRMDALSRLADLFPLPVSRLAWPPRTVLAAAAAMVLAVLAGMWHIPAIQLPGAHPAPALAQLTSKETLQTAVGERTTVTLQDGSRLTLNTDSLIRTLYTDDQRLLFLERGEAYVEVAHDSRRPLSVFIGEKVVHAVGTAFNLRITPDHRIELLVTEGRVLVGVAEKDRAAVPAGDASSAESGSSVQVSAGERILLGDADEAIEQVHPEEIRVKLSWRGGNLVFRGESLAEALIEIERYTPVEFIILDESLKKIRIVGLFKAGDVQGLLTTLSENFDIAYHRVSDERVVLTSKQP